MLLENVKPLPNFLFFYNCNKIQYWTWQNGQVGSRSIGLQIKRVVGKKRVILSRLKMGSGQSGCGLGRPIFSHEFFYFKKTTCICHLESHATNYLI